MMTFPIVWSYLGGGVACGDALLTNCTFSGNSACDDGGGVACMYGRPRLTNCILWGDTPDEIHEDPHSTTTVTRSDVQGGWPGRGNIDADPLFVDPDGPDNDPNTVEDNDYRLSSGSPCIDAGNNRAVPPDELDLDGDGDTTEPISMDLGGRLRFADRIDMPDTGVLDPNFPEFAIVDMGAFEYQFSGDLNGDGLIGEDDLFTLLDSYGLSNAIHYDDGDLDQDGDVDLSDLAALLASYGQQCP